MTTTRIWRGRWAFALLMGTAALALVAARNSDASGATATASGGKSVDIVSFAFHPATLKIGRGAKVAFTNTSNTAHTATGSSFDTKRIQPGKTKVVKFERTGTFAYHCKIHPFMKGKIVVE